MRFLISWFSLMALTLFLYSCAHQKTQTSSPAPSPNTWPAKMQALSQTLSSLLPYIANSQKFNDSLNQDRILQQTTRLKDLAHSLHHNTQAPSADPSLKMVSGLFEEDIERALVNLKSGNRDYARNILRDTTAYCLQCHTQSNAGPEFPKLSLNMNMNELSVFDRAEFYAATRQFDRAIEEYQNIIADKKLAKQNVFEWERAARAALAITVKVKKDPHAGLVLVEKMKKNPSTPGFLRDILKPWERSLKEWQNEKKMILRSPLAATKFAEKLIQKAQKQQRFPLDHSQDILYFRAAALLYDALSADNGKPEEIAHTLYLAGLASEATRDMNFWTLHETYFEKCIQKLPHSEQAEQCYTRLKDSVYVGYSGSAGTQIPPEEQRRLNQMEKLASTKER